MHSVPVQTFAQDAVLFYQQNREHTDSAVVRRQERMDKMKYTSAQANKLLKKLNDEYSALLDKEQRSRDFRAAMGEDVVYIPQLTRRKNKLLEMKSRLPKERVEEQYGRQSNIIDYRYANYDIAAVEADYDKTVDELSRAQLALDAINGRETFDLGE